MKTKKDENYFNNGIIEMYQRDKQVYIRNLLSDEEYNECVKRAKVEFLKLKEEINQKIEDIIVFIKEKNPLPILLNMAQQEMMSNFFLSSESQMNEESIIFGQAIMYLQSVIASDSDINFNNPNLTEQELYEIQQKICDIIKLYQQSFIGLKYVSQNDGSVDNDTLRLKMYLELMNGVTGNRYQCFQQRYFEILLIKQNDLIFDSYGITAKELIEKLEKYNKYLSFGIEESKGVFEKSFENFQEYGYKDPDNYRKELHKTEEFSKSYETLFGAGLYDVGEITDLPIALLNDLSYSIGEDKEFSSLPDPYFPDKLMSINKKPLLKVENKYYCFWSRTLFDRFYRILYKIVTKNDPRLKEIWNNNQKEATEKNILNLICESLNFTEFQSNNFYYYKLNGQNQKCENDSIIFYENKILVLEIKAGAISASSVAEDFESFENNFNDIFNKGIKQGERLIDLISQQDVPLYDEDNNLKFIIPKTDVSNIFVLNITIDDLNEIAASFEKTKYATYSKSYNCMCMSLSDLLVYCDYFEDKISFFHFLSNRCRAVRSDKIKVNDELDHLGLYISHNNYSMYADALRAKTISWNGYRLDIDKYYCNKYTYQDIEKPKQNLPQVIFDIIKFLNNSPKYDNSIDIAVNLLDLCNESKHQINNMVMECVKNHQTKCLFLKGEEVNYSIAVDFQVKRLKEKDIDNHIYATMRGAGENTRKLFHIIYDHNELIDVIYKEYNIKDLDDCDIDFVDRLKDEIIQKRIMTSNRKIGRNDLCPCGSGKKYKKCCLR